MSAVARVAQCKESVCRLRQEVRRFESVAWVTCFAFKKKENLFSYPDKVK